MYIEKAIVYFHNGRTLQFPAFINQAEVEKSENETQDNEQLSDFLKEFQVHNKEAK